MPESLHRPSDEQEAHLIPARQLGWIRIDYLRDGWAITVQARGSAERGLQGPRCQWNRFHPNLQFYIWRRALWRTPVSDLRLIVRFRGPERRWWRSATAWFYRECNSTNLWNDYKEEYRNRKSHTASRRGRRHPTSHCSERQNDRLNLPRLRHRAQAIPGSGP